jgi:hypothetical protein
MPRTFFIIFTFLACFPGSLAAAAAAGTVRRASEREIRQLFDLAILEPSKAKVVAVVTTYEKPWSSQQVMDEVRSQNQLLAFREKGLDLPRQTEVELARSNAIWRATSGKRWSTSGSGIPVRNFAPTKMMKP